MDTIEDRALGAFLGLAVGDAIGMTNEFEPRDDAGHLADMVGGGPFDLKAGEWTDDTSMAWALADSLVVCGKLNTLDLMGRFVRWWREGAYASNGRCFDIGVTTANALRRFQETGEPLAGSDDPYSVGNGSIMRLAPIALWGFGRPEADLRAAARLQSKTTHAATTCLDACEAMAVMLTALIRREPLGDVLERGGSTKTKDPALRGVLGGGWRTKDRQAISSSGYVVHTLEAAMWCVDQASGFDDAVLLAANLGDDADTVAAVTGQLAGAAYGASSIRKSWLDRLAHKDALIAVGRRLIAT